MRKGDGVEVGVRLIESWFPYLGVSRLVAADRRSKDSIYGVHKWFARRPPTLVRALLLAAHLDSDCAETEFWAAHSKPGAWLSEAVVYDPFMGGGTSLVEAARMGAAVVGRDIDPVASAIVSSELDDLPNSFASVAKDLLKDLQAEVGGYYAGPDTEWTPLHWFWLLQPTCPECGHSGLLYKDLILATASGRAGAVVRDDQMYVFCPDCLSVRGLDLDRSELRCCGRRHKIRRGSYLRGKYQCPQCGSSSSHEDLQTATSDRVLVAVEETSTTSHRRIRSATGKDRDLVEQASKDVAASTNGFDVPLDTDRRDRRPVSAGYTSTRRLFTARQWAIYTRAFEKVRTAGHESALERDLTLMLTGSLPANNLLCAYARDWGRLAPLFSVRGFSLPWLIVEINPFHPTAGRGTFRSAYARITDRARTSVRRARMTNDSLQVAAIDLPVRPSSVDVICASADDSRGQTEIGATICVTDPPYFDYIAYSELSEFFRVWLREPRLKGDPLLPSTAAPVESFSIGLGGALKATLARLRPGTPLVFTYHSVNSDAWTAIGDALDVADLAIVALWPVLADPHMGHHSASGNCEWDVVVVARRRGEIEELDADGLVDLPSSWQGEITGAGFTLGPGDIASFEHAWKVGKPRFGVSKHAHLHSVQA